MDPHPAHGTAYGGAGGCGWEPGGGGCCLGSHPEEGVVDKDHEVFGYPGLYVTDGSAMSANLGVNPSLSITAMAERALSKLPSRGC